MLPAEAFLTLILLDACFIRRTIHNSSIVFLWLGAEKWMVGLVSLCQ